MRLTGTFLDEISYDIPHQNWGYQEWDRDFAAMAAMGFCEDYLRLPLTSIEEPHRILLLEAMKEAGIALK